MQNTVSDAMMAAPGLSGNSEATIRSTDNFNRTVFGRLLWKDWRVVRQVVVAIAVIMPVLQLLLVMLSFGILARGGPYEDILGPTVLITMLAPTFVALGCSGMLVGHERQTGTWGWSSVLPTSWRSALLSKLAVTLSACIAVFCISAIIPSVLFASGQLPFVSFRSEFALIPLVIFLVWFEIIAFFYLALLLFREPLVGLVVGAIAVSIAQLIVIGALTRASTDFLMWTGLVATREAAEIVLMFSLGTIFFLTGTACMVWAFRWRWTYGQTTPLSFWNKRLRSVPAKAIEYRVREGISPTEWGSQFVLAFQQMLGLRLLVISGIVPAVSWLNRYELRDMLSAVVFQSIGILGATTFAGDQGLGRFRFLADRGVSIAKLVTTRLIIAMGFVLVGLAACKLGISIGSPRFGLELNGFASPELLFLAFSMGALGSLCFRRPIIAVTVTAILLGFCGAALLGLYKNIRTGMLASILRDEVFYKLYSAFILGCSCVMIAAIYKIANRWVVQDRVKLGLRYVAAFPLAILVSVLLLLHFGFLLQPSYDPKDFPLAALEEDIRKIPEIRNPHDLFKAIDITIWDKATDPRYGRVFDPTINPHSDAFSIIASSLKVNEAEGEDWLQRAKKDLESLEDRNPSSGTSSSRLNQLEWEGNLLLAKLAIVGRLTAAEREFEVSRQTWQYVKKLMDIDCQLFSAGTRKGRAMVWWALSNLSDQEISELGGPQAVRELCPRLDANADHFRKAIYLNSIYALAEFNGEPSRNELLKNRLDGRVMPWYFGYPPVKWFAMRIVVADYLYLTSTASGVSAIRTAATEYQHFARQFLSRLDRLQAAADQSDQSDRTDL